MKFRVDAGDSVLSEHLLTAPRIATYSSSIIQNQVIDIFADQIRQNIISRVKKVKWHGVVTDEVTDISNKEQLSLVVRYVDHDGLLLQEDLVAFIECDTCHNWLCKS